jgi:hypothetical protein
MYNLSGATTFQESGTMRLPIAVTAFVFFLASSFARCAEPPAPPPELKKLEPYVGTWKVAEFVSKKAEWTPEEVRTSGAVATTKWIMNGWYLEDRNAPGQAAEHLSIWRYDQAEKAYHYTMFQAPGGIHLDFTIRWNEKAQTFDGTAEYPNGVTMRTSGRFPNKDTKEWTAIATDSAGKVYLDMKCKEVRVEATKSGR